MALGKKVKGITIEFNSDTTKLGKAIGNVDKQTKTLDNQLKAVNRSLKFNPGNTELIAQKQQLLGQKVEETKKRLDLLREAQAKMDDDPAVDKTSQDYMELRREIIETESKLKHFEGQLKELNNIKFEQLGESAQNVGNKMKSVGEGMTKYVTGPIVAAGGAAVAAFKEVDAGMDIIVGKTGATGKELDAMKESAEELATSIPTDFETAGTAIGEVNTRFGLTGQALEDLSGKFIKFADLNDTDVNNAIDKTQKALSAFGLDAEDAGSVLDQLNRVGQNTGVSMDTLLDGLVQNGTAFQEMGLNIGEAATMMGQLEKSGANGDTVMQGLRRALKNAAEDGVPLNDALAQLQDTIKNGTGDMDGLTAAYDLFGKSGDQIYGAVKNGTIDFTKLGLAAEDAAGSVDKTFEETMDPADKFQMAMNQAKVAGYEVGTTVLENVAPAIEKLSDFLQSLTEKWQSLSPETQDFIIKAAGIAAAIGPILVIVGGLITKVGMLITFLPALGSAFSFLLGPVGLVIAAVAALIAIGVALYKNWDKIKAAAGAVKDWVVEKFTALKDKVSEIFGKIKDAMLAPIEKARDLIKKIIEKIKSFFDFKFKLPHIKLPHFGIQPPGWRLSDLLEGIIPTLGIDWYAKGGIFKSPQVIGVGDSPSPEAVVPIDRLLAMINTANAQMISALITALQAMNTGANGGEYTIEINLGGSRVATEVYKLSKQGKMILEA